MSKQDRKVGTDECRGVLSLEAWQTAQEVAVALGHKGGSADGAAVMARGCLHALTQCKMAESRPRKSDSPKSGRAPIEFRLTEHGADKSAPPPPAATRKAGTPSKAKSAKAKPTKRPYQKPAEAKTRRTASALLVCGSAAVAVQEINATFCGDNVVEVRIPYRVSVGTLRSLTGVAETFAKIGGHDDDTPFLPLALTAKK